MFDLGITMVTNPAGLCIVFFRDGSFATIAADVTTIHPIRL